jgi:signal transduction histidine kinase
VDVGDLVARAATATIPESMTLDLHVAPDLPLVTGFHEPLVRAVSNILVNAVEACGGVGSVTVRVEPTTFGTRGGVCISIRDTGPGMSPGVLARIFDPYVTTKAGGTGLGLAIARQTITAHDGIIEAMSAVGRGTEFRLLLPLEPGKGEPA